MNPIASGTFVFWLVVRFLFCYFTHSLHGVESSWEANRFSASKEISRILWNPKVHYLIPKSSPLSLSWARSVQPISSIQVSEDES